MIILGKYKVVNTKRFKIFIFVTTFLISLLFFITITTITAYPKEEVQYDYVCVKTGDTLWDIAQQYETDINLRCFIDLILKENSKSDCLIYPGDILKIPLH